MNLQQTKALFFAQYLGQKVYMRSEITGDAQQIYVSNLAGDIFDTGQEYSIKNGILILRSVNQLTDEEYTIFAGICIPYNKGYVDAIDGKNILDYFVNGYAMDTIKMNDLHMGTDYLRSIGTLLSFTYLNEENKPITLQPEEIVSLGWAKYQES